MVIRLNCHTDTKIEHLYMWGVHRGHNIQCGKKHKNIDATEPQKLNLSLRSGLSFHVTEPGLISSLLIILFGQPFDFQEQKGHFSGTT